MVIILFCQTPHKDCTKGPIFFLVQDLNNIGPVIEFYDKCEGIHTHIISFGLPVRESLVQNETASQVGFGVIFNQGLF